MFNHPLYYQNYLKELERRDLWKLSIFSLVFIAGLIAFFGTVYFGWMDTLQPILKYTIDIGIGALVLGLSSFVLIYDPKSSKRVKIHAK